MTEALIGKCADCGRRALLSGDFKCRDCEAKASAQMLGGVLAVLLLIVGGIALWIVKSGPS